MKGFGWVVMVLALLAVTYLVVKDLGVVTGERQGRVVMEPMERAKETAGSCETPATPSSRTWRTPSGSERRCPIRSAERAITGADLRVPSPSRGGFSAPLHPCSTRSSPDPWARRRDGC